MEDDFEFPSAGNVNDDVEDELMGVPEDDVGPASPIVKVGEEKKIGKNGLKKKLVKEGEGWEKPGSGDEVEGTSFLFLSGLCWFLFGWKILVSGKFI